MPVVFRVGNVRFLFYADEGEPREPIHIHALEGDREAKFWIEPSIRMARNAGFRRHELNRIAVILEDRGHEIVEAWNEFFGI